MINVLALVTFKIFPSQMGGQKGVVFFYKHVKAFLNVSIAVSRNNKKAPANWQVEKVLFDNRKMFLNPFVFWLLKKIIQQKRIQLIIAEHSYAAWMAWVLKKMFRLPFIIHSHNIEASRFRQMHRGWWRLYWHFEKWVHQKADHNFFISREDEEYALKNFNLQPQKCSVVTYGIEVPGASSIAKEQWRASLGLGGSTTLFYFNGTLDYSPNYDAVMVLLHKVAPLLQKKFSDFRILISGNRAPQALVDQLEQHPHFLYIGFVEDVQSIYQLAQVFVNPVANNSGIKTKVIEALAAHCTVVTTHSGAAGIEREVCGAKLVVAEDNNWPQFTELLLQQAQQPHTQTPQPFFDTYLWNNIAQKAAFKIAEVVRQHAR
jgi:glycosyltransferase involved in cell wall biosynthesis